MKITLEDLADLSPNMRKVLKNVGKDGEIPAKSTYWITLQGMISRGLVQQNYAGSKDPSVLTNLGFQYRDALRIKEGQSCKDET